MVKIEIDKGNVTIVVKGDTATVSAELCLGIEKFVRDMLRGEEKEVATYYKELLKDTIEFAIDVA